MTTILSKHPTCIHHVYVHENACTQEDQFIFELLLTLRLHTKHWFGLNLSMQLLFGIPIMKFRLLRWRRCRGLLPGGPSGDGGTPVASVKC